MRVLLTVWVFFGFLGCRSVDVEHLDRAGLSCLDIVMRDKNSVEAFYFQRRLDELGNRAYFDDPEDCNNLLIITIDSGLKESTMLSGWFTQSNLSVSIKYELIDKANKAKDPVGYIPIYIGSISAENYFLNSKTKTLLNEISRSESKKIVGRNLAEELYERIFVHRLKQVITSEQREEETHSA